MKINPYSKLCLICLACFCVLISACRSHKELIYFRDANGNEKITSAAKALPAYRIKKKDNLFISIISPNPDLNKVYNPVQAGFNVNQNSQFDNQAEQYINGYEVDAKGAIELPIIGKITLEGKTIPEAQKEIETHSNVYLKDVTVKVKLLSFRVTVIGEVKLPGVYYNYNDNFSVVDAIGMANGNTDFANLATVMVLRPTDAGSTTYTLNLNSKDALSSDAYYLQPNDKVIVQPAQNKNSQIQISTGALILSGVTSILLLLDYLKK